MGDDQALLNEEQKVPVAEYQRSKCESVQRELEEKVREKLKETPAASCNVTPLFKVRCVDPALPISTLSAVLSVWCPSEDVIAEKGHNSHIVQYCCSRGQVIVLRIAVYLWIAFHYLTHSQLDSFMPSCLSAPTNHFVVPYIAVLIV